MMLQGKQGISWCGDPPLETGGNMTRVSFLALADAYCSSDGSKTKHLWTKASGKALQAVNSSPGTTLQLG